MQNLLKQFSSELLKTSLSSVRQRFPFAIPLIFVISFFLSLAPYSNSYEVIYWRLSIIGILTFLLTIGGYLSLETRKTTRFNHLFILIPIFYGIYYYFITDIIVNTDTKSITHSILHLIGFISFIFFAPYISHINTEERSRFKYTNYFSRIA